MQTSNTNQNFLSDDQVWVLLAELSFSDSLPEQDRKEELAAGYLLQSLRELGIPPECLENITRTFAGFAKEPSWRAQQRRLKFPERIRIFCQKKRIEAANPAKLSTPFPTAQEKEQKQIFPDPGVGGWGYFMIARVEVLPPDSSAIPHSCMDLYLYREGE